MSKKSDELMLQLPCDRVADWLRAELADVIATHNGYQGLTVTQQVSLVTHENVLANLIAKLGGDS